jgi:hypothetical protein
LGWEWEWVWVWVWAWVLGHLGQVRGSSCLVWGWALLLEGGCTRAQALGLVGAQLVAAQVEGVVRPLQGSGSGC